MKETQSDKKRMTFFSVLFTFFIDMLGWCLVFPIFAPLFLDPHNSIFSKEISIATRTLILGVFLAAYPLAQFFGSPVLGETADCYGRKKALLLSILLTFGGYILSAWSIHTHNLVILFLSRIITGLFSGNMSICLATLSDISTSEKAKVKSFSYLSILAGFSFILGPFLGGRFSDRLVNEYFNPALPFWIASALSFFNFLFLLMAFKETHEVHKNVKFDFLESVHNIKQALKIPKLKSVYMLYFLYLFAWVILMQFIPVLVVRKFDFTNSGIGNLAAFMGLCWVGGSVFVQKRALDKKGSLKTLEISLILFTIACAFIIFPKNMWPLFFLVAVAMLLGGVAWPICTSLISNMATKRMQGKIMGISQSMQSLAMIVAPLAAGIANNFYAPLPFILATMSSLVASLIFFRIEL